MVSNDVKAIIGRLPALPVFLLFSSMSPLVLDKVRTPPKGFYTLCTCVGFSQYESSDVLS